MPSPVLSLVVIARDEERCIGRLLRSVAPFVDEMVVVDTGSVDATAQIAASEGAQVAHFEWGDDFSAAKNHGLACAEGDMRLVLDADEWLIDGGPELRNWLRGSPLRFGTVACTSTFGADGQTVTDHLVRLLPAGARFEGRVHEQPIGTFLRAASPLHIAHDGYELPQMARKCGRNESLLRRELETSPADGYLWYQLGCALDVDDRHVEACGAFEEALGLETGDVPHRHPLVVRYLYCLGRAARFDDALAFYRRQAIPWADSPDLHFVMADVLFDLALARPSQADAIAPVIVRLLERCLAIGERPDLPGAVAGRGRASARRNLDVCQSWLPSTKAGPDRG